MESFDEFDEKAKEIMTWFEVDLYYGAMKFGISYRSPRHDIARRFLNEINEFKPLKRGRKI